MNLKILLPFKIFMELTNIVRVVLDTTNGSYGFLPRNAIAGADLGKLHESIEKEFKNLDESECSVRIAVAKLESEFIQNVQKLHQD